MIVASTRTVLTNPDTQKMLRDALETSRSRQAVALMLKMAGASAAHVHYMGGSIILMDSEGDPLPLQERIQPWFVQAIGRERLASILTETETGEIGSWATPAEVLAYLHPVTPNVSWWPLSDDWLRIYLWARHNVLSRHEGKLSWELVDAQGEPVQLSKIILTKTEQDSYRDLACRIRRRVVETTVRREVPAIYRCQQIRPIFFNIGESFESLFREDWPDKEALNAFV